MRLDNRFFVYAVMVTTATNVTLGLGRYVCRRCRRHRHHHRRGSTTKSILNVQIATCYFNITYTNRVCALTLNITLKSRGDSIVSETKSLDKLYIYQTG